MNPMAMVWKQKESVAVSISHQIRAEDDWAELSVKSWLRLSTPVPARKSSTCSAAMDPEILD
jgi:hypothetical protein